MKRNLVWAEEVHKLTPARTWNLTAFASQKSRQLHYSPLSVQNLCRKFDKQFYKLYL